MIVNVIVPLALNEPFSYETDYDLDIGDLVIVPFGNKDFVGLVIDINVKIKEGIELKKVKEALDLPPLKQELIDFIKWTADYNLIPLGNVLKMVINPVSFLRNKVEKYYCLSTDYAETPLTPLIRGGYWGTLISGGWRDTLISGGCEDNLNNGGCEGDLSRRECKSALSSVEWNCTSGSREWDGTTGMGDVRSPLARGEKDSTPSKEEYGEVFSREGHNNIIGEEDFNKKPKLTPKQQLVVNFLKNKIATKEEILNSVNVGSAVLKKLIENGIVKEIKKEKEFIQNINKFNLNKLSTDQKKAFNAICNGCVEIKRGLFTKIKEFISPTIKVNEISSATAVKDAILPSNANSTTPFAVAKDTLSSLTANDTLPSPLDNGILISTPDKGTPISSPDKGTPIFPPDKGTPISPPDKGGEGGFSNYIKTNTNHINNKDNTVSTCIDANYPYNLQQINSQIKKPANKIKLKFNTFVLEGTTGSGKTEVYFHLIARLIKNTDKQALILLPEIALTSQLISRFKKQFNFEPAVWHSEITESRKSDIFKGVLNGNIKVVIGTRSALFLPFQDLGFIVVDEEHDASYKQSENGCYNGRDLAIVRAKMNNIPILLSSATPSLETLINIDKGKYVKVDLPSRYGKSVLPDIEIIDMKNEKLKKDKYISKILLNNLEKNFQDHKQSLLFMNKRGYAPVILCGDCGEKFVCPNCSCNLSLHKTKNRLICHHCEYFIEKPTVCPHCGSENLIDFGPGVEKIEKEIREYLPNAKTIIMASDTVDTNRKLEEIINKILNNEIDIIIGTQLVAKGHHFPNLTLVGIIDSDASLFGGDIRASERTYQLLTQVSGRAGREEVKGRVYFQTYNPDNLILQAIKNGDKELLMDFEKQNRELGGFPPFGKMALISIASLNEAYAYRVAKKIVKKIPFNENIEVMGPAPAIISKLAKMFRFNVIIKTTRDINIQKLIQKTVLSEKYNSNVRIKVEIM